MKPWLCIVLFTTSIAIGAGWWCAGFRKPSAHRPPAELDVPGKTVRQDLRTPAGIGSRLRAIRRAKGRAEQLRKVVTLASSLPPGEFRKWHDGKDLEFIDGLIEGVFYRILEARWMEEDPAELTKWKLKSERGKMSGYFAAWIEVDEAGAVEFTRNVPPEQKERALSGLITAVGKRDCARAFALHEELAGRRYGKPVYPSRQILAQLALSDRDAVLGEVRGWGNKERKEALSTVGVAWVDKEFPWVIDLLESEGIGGEGLRIMGSTVDNASKLSRALLEHSSLVPTEWFEQLSEDGDGNVTMGCELDWLGLEAPPPGLSPEVLEQFHLRASEVPWWNNEKRAPGIRLVEEGDWLSVEVRSNIARNLTREWRDDPEAAKLWTAGLDGEIRAAAEVGL